MNKNYEIKGQIRPRKARFDEQLLKARQYHNEKKPEDAEIIYRQILEQSENNFSAMLGLALALQQQHKAEDAIAILATVIKLHGESYLPIYRMGNAKFDMGLFSEAETLYLKSLELNPSFANSYYQLAHCKKYSGEESLISKAEELLRQPDISQDAQCTLHFTLGKIYDDCKNYREAFRHYRKGNARVQLQFSQTDFHQHINQLIANFSVEYMASVQSSGVSDDRPVFIVGMPRSGTTLTEQILASHRDVAGMGELRDIHNFFYFELCKNKRVISGKLSTNKSGRVITSGTSDAFSGYRENITREKLQDFAQLYLEKAENLVGAGPVRFIDKMPANFTYLPLIKLIFPRARIIHCVRNTLDTCLSCYFQNFVDSQSFSFTLSNIACYYSGYLKLMQHWTKNLDIPVYTMRYQDLVGHGEREIRALLDFLDLEWDENCLSPQEFGRSVRTASSWQVRQPIYSKSVYRWKNYESELEPLVRAFELEGVPLNQDGDFSWD